MNEHVGDGEGAALDARRQANLHHAQQLVLLDGQVLGVQAVGALHLGQAPEHQPRGDTLGDHRGDGHTLYPHVEHDDEHQVQYHVDDPGQQQKVQGPLGVPHSPENGRAEIVEHHHRHAHKVDAHIQHRLVQHVRRGAHQLQHRPGQGDAREDERHPKGQAGEHRGVHRLRQVLVLAGPVVLGGQHVGAHGEAHKQVDDQVDDARW